MRFAGPDHRAAARVLGYALVANDPEIYLIASEVLRLRLARAERSALAVSTLLALEEEDIEPTLGAAFNGALDPHAYLVSPLDEAKDWAAWASDEERAAKCLANFRAMSSSYQRTFLAQVGAGAA